jgi:hypothetical protein
MYIIFKDKNNSQCAVYLTVTVSCKWNGVCKTVENLSKMFSEIIGSSPAEFVRRYQRVLTAIFKLYQRVSGGIGNPVKIPPRVWAI